MKEAYKLAAYGPNAVKDNLRFGKIGKTEIEEGEKNGLRTGAVATKDSYQTQLIHGVDAAQFEAGAHDSSHSSLLSAIPIETRQAVLALVDVLRNVSGHHWSITLWEMVDFFYESNFSKPESKESVESLITSYKDAPLTQYFSHIICSDFRSAFFQQNNTPKCLLWTLVIDMVKHPVKWQQLHIDVTKLPAELSKVYAFANKYHQLIRNCNDKLAILKLALFYDESHKMAVSSVNNLIDQHAKNGAFDGLKFYRNNRTQPPTFSLKLGEFIIDNLDEGNVLLNSIDQRETKIEYNDTKLDFLDVYIYAGLTKDIDAKKALHELLATTRVTAYLSREDLIDELSRVKIPVDSDSSRPCIVKMRVALQHIPKDGVHAKCFSLPQNLGDKNQPGVKFLELDDLYVLEDESTLYVAKSKADSSFCADNALSITPGYVVEKGQECLQANQLNNNNGDRLRHVF